MLKINTNSNVVVLNVEKNGFGASAIARDMERMISAYYDEGYRVKASSQSHYNSMIMFFLGFITLGITWLFTRRHTYTVILEKAEQERK